jgi:hypothetical protein
VYRTHNGKYGAQIRHPRAKARTWLGTFDAAEDAASAYDDAAVKLLGAAAKTNLEQPTTGAAGRDGVESPTGLLNDFPELPALDFISHSFIQGAQLDDHWADLPEAERQLVDEFLNDTGFSDVAS